MKKILLSISTANAQTDYCKDITKSTSGSKVFYESQTPGDKKEDVSVLRFVKVIDGTGARTYFAIGGAFDESENTSSDVSITFEDDDVITFTDLTFKTGPKNQINSYVHSTLLGPLTAEQMAKFKTKKMKIYTILGKKRYVLGFSNPKVKIMAYANCIDGLNDGPPPVAATPEKKSIDGFLGIKFGATQDEAKARIIAKGGKFSQATEHGTIYHDVVFADRSTQFVSLQFTNDKFYEATVCFPAVDEVAVISRFNSMVDELNNVYNEADVSKKFVQPYKEGDGYEVDAIKFGNAKYVAFWNTNNGNTVQLQINKDLHLILYYTDTALEKLKGAKKSSDY